MERRSSIRARKLSALVVVGWQQQALSPAVQVTLLTPATQTLLGITAPLTRAASGASVHPRCTLNLQFLWLCGPALSELVMRVTGRPAQHDHADHSYLSRSSSTGQPALSARPSLGYPKP